MHGVSAADVGMIYNAEDTIEDARLNTQRMVELS